MRMQIGRFEDNGLAVLLAYPDGARSLGVPRELLPEPVARGDVFEVRFEREWEETERVAGENQRLLGKLLGGER